MPWWGFLLSGIAVWLIGLLTGRALGRAEVLLQLRVTRQMSESMNPLPAMQRRRPRYAQPPPPPG